MKIVGGGSKIPIENKPVQSTKTNQSDRAEKQSSTKVIDSVDARLTRALKAVEDGIYSSGLTAGEVHSNADENRIASLLRSMETVEAKGPTLENVDVIGLADRVAMQMQGNSQLAMNAHNSINGSRVLELTE